MRCRKVRALLPLYVGRDLPYGLEKKLEGHLQGCPSCSGEKAAYELALKRIQQEAAKERELDWQPQAWATLIDRISQEKHPRKLLLSPHRRWALAYGLAFCVLSLAWVGIFGGRFLRSGKMPSPPLKEVAASLGIESRAPFEEALPPTLTPEETLWTSFPEQKKETPIASMPSNSSKTTTVSLISQETGLQVIWVFNREFDWKGAIR